MIELIHRLNARGVTFLVIEHNLKVVRTFSQRVIVLDHGAKIAEGSAAEVLSDPQVVRAYLGKKEIEPVRREVADLRHRFEIADRRTVRLLPAPRGDQLELALLIGGEATATEARPARIALIVA